MTRSLSLTTVRKVWTATQSGWNLTFTLESGNNTTIFCNGLKPDENAETPPAPPAPGTSASLEAHLFPATNKSSVSFNGIAHDSTLAAAIITEMQTILTEEAI